MQLDVLVTAGREQRLGKAAPLGVGKKARGQPQGVIAVEVGPHLVLIALPPAMVRTGAGSLVGDHAVVTLDLPPAARRVPAGTQLRCDRTVGVSLNPVKEWLPYGARLLAREALLHHRDLERVVRAHRHLLAPVRVG